MKKILIIFTLIISLYADYNQMKIQDYINIVATQNSINIVNDKSIKKDFDFFINKKIEGKVSIKVLEDLLKNNGYLLEKINDDYYIIRSKKDLLINKIKIFKLKYADTHNIRIKSQAILEGYFKNIKTVTTSSKDKKFTPYEERKPQDNKSNLNTKIIEKKINYSINELDNKNIAVTYKDDFVPSVVQKIIDSIDKQPTRIKVKLVIYEVNSDALKEFSSQLDFKANYKGIQIGASSSSTSGDTQSGFAYQNGGTQKNISLSAVIHALEKNGEAKVKAEPEVFLYEGHSSYLQDGKSFPIAYNDTTVSNNTTTTSTKYKDKETGLIINLKFEQYRNGMIYLKLSLDISDADDYNTEDRQLVTVKRNLTTQMIIEPNKIIEMAGLTKSKKSHTYGGIPILKDIPYIGKLFQFEKRNNSNSVLVIQLHASLVADPHDKYKNIWEGK